MVYATPISGGGAAPRSGVLVIIDVKGSVLTGSGGGEVFVDTFRDGKRPLGASDGVEAVHEGDVRGVEYVLQSMRAGRKRRVVVPSELGFGDVGANFGGDDLAGDNIGVHCACGIRSPLPFLTD